MSDEVWRTYQIDCPEPREKSDAACPKCGLPQTHHRVRFELIKYDQAKDLWYLHPVQAQGFNLAVSANTRATVVPISGRAFSKFKLLA